MELNLTTSPRRAPATKHERVRESIRRLILDGTYAPGSRLPPETDLPRQLRASKITIVRALNDLAREGLIVRRRGSGSYVADPEQRPLMPGRFLRLGVLLPHSFFSDFRYGAQQNEILRGALAAWGLERMAGEFPSVPDHEATRGRWVSDRRGCSVEVLGEEHAARHRHPPLSAVREARFDGILTLSVVEEEWTAELLDLGIPTVLVDFPNERFAIRADQVFFDPFPGYRAAVREFTAHGLRRIWFLGCWMHQPYAEFAALQRDPNFYAPENARLDPDSFVRQSAWRQAMAEAGLRAPDEWVQATWPDEPHVRALAEAWAGLPAAERPEGVICHSYGQARTVAAVFAERGLVCAAAGATDAPAHGGARAILADNAQLGRIAVELLLWKLQQPKRPGLRVGVPLWLSDAPAYGSRPTS